MSKFVKNRELAEITLGRHVVKTGAVASANDDLFTFYGLNLVTLMYGEVTGVGDGGATTIALNEKTSSIDIMAATTVTSDAVGTLYFVSGHGTATANGGLAPTVSVATLTSENDDTVDRSPAHAPMIWNGGSSGLTIEQTETGDDATLVIDWHVWYIPLEADAYIEAAA